MSTLINLDALEFLVHVFLSQGRQSHRSSFWLVENIWINQSAALFLFGSGTVTDWLSIFGLTNQLLCFCLAVDGHSEERERERERERLDNKTGIMRRGRALVRSLCWELIGLFDGYLRLCISIHPISPVKRLSHG